MSDAKTILLDFRPPEKRGPWIDRTSRLGAPKIRPYSSRLQGQRPCTPVQLDGQTLRARLGKQRTEHNLSSDRAVFCMQDPRKAAEHA